MRHLILLLILCLAHLSWGNMASPITEGTWSASPFISQYVAIRYEKIVIIPDAEFKTAEFKIEYHITSDKDGINIPLLFYASEFKSDFRVWVDDEEIGLIAIPAIYETVEGTQFDDFGYLFKDYEGRPTNVVEINDYPNRGLYVKLEELKYFKTDLLAGDHIIRVEYSANQWLDESDWLKRYHFRYCLSPAKYWKSFGTLDITVDARAYDNTFYSNLGEPTSGDLSSIAHWNFTSLPAEVFEISHQAELSSQAQILIAIGPGWFSVLFSVLLILCHYFLIKFSRRKLRDKRYSFSVMLGSLIIPFLALISYMFGFMLIDDVIGAEAGRSHGYTIILVYLYPIAMPFYWLIMAGVDRYLKLKFRMKREAKLNENELGK